MPSAPEYPEYESRIFGRFVRGLTLDRPWPWCFLHAGKRVENRSWSPPLFLWDEWIALHAGQRFDHQAADKMHAGHFGDAARGVLASLDHPPAGSIFAIAKLDRARRFEPSIFHSRDPFAFGPVVWSLSDLRPLPRPIPVRGRQRLWRVTHEQAAEIEAQLHPEAITR